jgi:hypothetical protein
MFAKLEKRFKDLTPNKWAAILVWLVGAYNTRTFLMEMGVINALALVVIALAGQWVLTYVQRFIWRPRIVPVIADDGSHAVDEGGRPLYRKERGFLPWAALVIDCMINFGGAWFSLQGLTKTSVIAALFSALALEQGAGLTRGFVFVFALVVAYLIATAPEVLWKMSDPDPVAPVPDPAAGPAKANGKL